MRTKTHYLILLLVPVLLPAQSKTDLEQILERMDRLEEENRNLAAEVRALREELAAPRPAPAAASVPAEKPAAENASGAPPAPAPLEERVDVQEQDGDATGR